MPSASIKGLDIALPEGVPAVRKLGDARESVMVLVRGATGTGKTLFAVHLAVSEAVRLRGDVVYCCIELLPTELEAQLAGFAFGAEQHRVRVVHRNTARPSSSGEASPQLLADLIDVPSMWTDFGSELNRVIETARNEDLNPKVLVIDAAADGYRLGAGVSRLLADALSKFAAELGVVLILVEETSSDQATAWVSTADVVFELSLHEATPGGFDAYRLRVRKNRFGAAAMGLHGFSIKRSGGVEIHPQSEAPSAVIQRLRQRLYVIEPTYLAAVALYKSNLAKPTTVDLMSRARLDPLRRAVKRSLEIGRMIGEGWSISNVDLEKNS